MSEKVHHSKVLVMPANTVNPWFTVSIAEGLYHEERDAALTRFREGQPSPEVTFWYAEFPSETRRLTSADEVDWSAKVDRCPKCQTPVIARPEKLFWCPKRGCQWLGYSPD